MLASATRPTHSPEPDIISFRTSKMRIGITLTSSLDVDQKYIDLTEKVASAIASKNYGIVYGGTDYGMMRKLAETYKKSGGRDLCGVFAKDLMEVTKNYTKFSSLDEEHVVDTVEERKRKIISLSDAYLILPGGYGTLEEIGSIVGGQANKLYPKPSAFLNYEGFYDYLFKFLDEVFNKRFSRIQKDELFFISDNLEEVMVYFREYSSKNLKDKFV